MPPLFLVIIDQCKDDVDDDSEDTETPPTQKNDIICGNKVQILPYFLNFLILASYLIWRAGTQKTSEQKNMMIRVLMIRRMIMMMVMMVMMMTSVVSSSGNSGDWPTGEIGHWQSVAGHDQENNHDDQNFFENNYDHGHHFFTYMDNYGHDHDFFENKHDHDYLSINNYDHDYFSINNYDPDQDFSTCK